jgi:hypothetical protein
MEKLILCLCYRQRGLANIGFQTMCEQSYCSHTDKEIWNSTGRRRGALRDPLKYVNMSDVLPLSR